MKVKKFCKVYTIFVIRYYGDSHPTEDMSVKNLAFLSSEQALADLATFRAAMADKYNLTESNK